VADYVIRGGEEGRARLSVIGDALAASTAALLESANLGAGMRCLDLGCGGGDVTVMMARTVGPGGHVVGVDMDAVKVRLAQQDARDRGLEQVEFRTGDAAALDADSEYDLVYARLLLTHLSDPEETLRRMIAAVEPGGVVVVEDLEHSAVFAYPKCHALDRYVGLYNDLACRRQGDPDIGPKLPGLFGRCELDGLHLRLTQPVFLDGPAKRIHSVTLENVRESLLATGVATADEIASLAAELEVYADTPSTMVAFPRIYQVHGRRRHRC
jgi:SAM-dependent methyltransferase